MIDGCGAGSKAVRARVKSNHHKTDMLRCKRKKTHLTDWANLRIESRASGMTISLWICWTTGPAFLSMFDFPVGHTLVGYVAGTP